MNYIAATVSMSKEEDACCSDYLVTSADASSCSAAYMLRSMSYTTAGDYCRL